MRQEDRGLLITLYAFTVLMDLGLDPAIKQARKMGPDARTRHSSDRSSG